MLRFRICPNCHQEIRSPKLFFCYRCGAKLPPSPKVDDSRRGNIPPKAQGSRAIFRWWGAALTVLFLLAAAALVFLFAPGRLALTKFSLFNSVEKPSSEPQKKPVPVTGLDFAADNHPFTAKGLAEAVPAKVDLYVEGRNPGPFLRTFLPPEEWEKLEGVVLEKTGLAVDEAVSFLEDDFAVVQQGTASAFLARSRDADFLAQQLLKQEDFEGWRGKLVGGFLVMTDSPELTAKIEAALNKQTLNLALTSSFVEARKDIPPGQLFVYGRKRPWFLPADVTVESDAYVVARRNGKTIVVEL